MNKINYALFEIIKYKIEFLECLEYSLISDTIKKEDIKNHLNYLKNEFYEGNYHEIISSIYTSYKKINTSLLTFFKKYNYKKTNKIINKNKLKLLLNYNESLIDCYQCFNDIIQSIISEEQLSKDINKKIINLNNINENHFKNFLFFNSYNLYLNCFYNKDKLLKSSDKDIKRLVGIINYCNTNNEFNSSIDILKECNENNIYKELERLSNNCIQLEKKQHDCLKEILEIINTEIEKSKNK